MLAFWMSSIGLASLELRLWFGATFSWGHGGESHSPEFLTLCSLTSLDPKWWVKLGQEVGAEVGVTSRTPKPRLDNVDLDWPQLQPQHDIIS
jgi:hypothetical protein